MNKVISLFAVTLLLAGCNLQATNPTENNGTLYLQNVDSLKVLDYYKKNKGNNSKSKSIGSVSKGKLENGKLFPFYGPNYTYFDTSSYFAERAFTHEKVKSIIIDTYNELAIILPARHFYLMELSNKLGGEIFPHKTHQNGLSADFMMPKLKNNIPYYGLDTLGKDHYWLDFDNDGRYSEDNEVKVDFDLIARHILMLQSVAKTYDYNIAKVIIKIEYKDDLFSTPYGQKLKNSGIYVVKSLTPLVNNIHDDHYHIDFKKT